MKLEKQMQYCHENNLIFFAPYDGKCDYCGKEITDTDEKLITGCPHCHRSFVE
jgi:hypothetical protein